MEKIEIMKKQQIGEIKNIIDNAYKTQEIKFRNDEKLRLQ